MSGSTPYGVGSIECVARPCDGGASLRSAALVPVVVTLAVAAVRAPTAMVPAVRAATAIVPAVPAATALVPALRAATAIVGAVRAATAALAAATAIVPGLPAAVRAAVTAVTAAAAIVAAAIVGAAIVATAAVAGAAAIVTAAAVAAIAAAVVIPVVVARVAFARGVRSVIVLLFGRGRPGRRGRRGRRRRWRRRDLGTPFAVRGVIALGRHGATPAAGSSFPAARRRSTGVARPGRARRPNRAWRRLGRQHSVPLARHGDRGLPRGYRAKRYPVCTPPVAADRRAGSRGWRRLPDAPRSRNGRSGARRLADDEAAVAHGGSLRCGHLPEALGGFVPEGPHESAGRYDRGSLRYDPPPTATDRPPAAPVESEPDDASDGGRGVEPSALSAVLCSRCLRASLAHSLHPRR